MSDWDRPRSTTDYLNEREIATLRRAFDEGMSTSDAAGQVNCSTRVASKYYAKFRGGPLQRDRPRHQTPTPVVPQSRFYKSNFEL